MKIKDFKNNLKENAINISLDDKSQTIIQEIESLPLNNHFSEPKKKNNSFLFIPLAVSLCASIGVIAIGVITGLNEGSSPNKIQLSYAKQVASLTNFVVSQGEQNHSKSIKRQVLSNDKYDEIAYDINHYLYTIEQFNENSFILTTDNKQLSIKYQNVEYRFSYTEQKVNEYRYIIEGEVYFGDTSYVVSGQRNCEKDETNIIMKLYLSDNEYYLVEQEIELHENEYTYSHFFNNQELESISLEIEDGSTELSITKNEIDVVECEFEYERGKFICEYSSTITNNDEIEVQIESQEDNYVYIFETGYKKELKKL